MGAIFNASGRSYYILEHKTESKYHHAGESQKIIVDQIELGRDSSCQVRFDESFETVSRRHAAIVKEGNDYKLIPLSQTNTTLINGQVVTGEWHLTSGDEIRLSSKGPLLGFIVPQGEQSLVKSIGFTERLNLFRKQALRPYKTALWILAIVLILAVAGLVTWNVLQGQKFEKDLELKQQQIELQRRRLYPDLYDANGNLIVKKPEPPKAKAQPVVIRDEDEDDEEIEALVAATRRLTKKAAATPSKPVPAPKQSVKPIKQKDGTVRYFEEEEDDVEDLKVLPPKLIPAVPIAPAAPQREISGKGDGATSSWIIPLDD